MVRRFQFEEAVWLRDQHSSRSSGRKVRSRATDDAVAQVETRLQGRDALLHKPTLERMQYWLERVGDTTWEEVEECFRENLEEIAHLLEELLHQERAYRSCDGQIAATLHSRDYLALQGPNHTSQSKALRSIIVRYLRCHGPFSIQTLAERYKIAEAIAVVLVQLGEKAFWCRDASGASRMARIGAALGYCGKFTPFH